MLSATNICKSFPSSNGPIDVLKNVSVVLTQGEFTAIVGRSGSGKTTLLNVLSTLVRPDDGTLSYFGDPLAGASETQLNHLRQRDFSMIFQFHHLLPYLSVLENTLLPYLNSLKPIGKQVIQQAHNCLVRVGLGDKADRIPDQLSGGEQQRVAIARALVKSSTVLFADEPTGSLDRTNGGQIMELLTELNREGLTIVMVTHEPAYAARAERIIEIDDGCIVSAGS